MSSPVIVRVSHRFTAPAERVFDAWLIPNQAARFFFATRTGNIMRCEIDARVGGTFLVTDRRPQADGDESVFDAEHHGTYLQIDRPERLVFDLAVSPHSEEPTRVTIDITPESPNSCELTLTHEMGDTPMARAYELQTLQGWTKMLDKLERELFPRRIAL